MLTNLRSKNIVAFIHKTFEDKSCRAYLFFTRWPYYFLFEFAQVTGGVTNPLNMYTLNEIWKYNKNEKRKKLLLKKLTNTNAGYET